MKNFMIIIVGLIAFNWGCKSDRSNEQIEADIDSVLQITKKEKTMLPDEKVEEIVKSIPSPIEMTALIKASGAKYSQKILNNTDHVSNYTSNFDKAINLGVYGADLGYINLYEKSHTIISYLDAVKELSEELKVEQFFDFTTIKRLAENNLNLDSIIYISTSGFEKMDDYLKEKYRGNISTLILFGGWLEALHIATEVVQNSESPPQELIDRIGEQKIVLDDLMLLLSVYQNYPKFYDLINEMSNLKKVYDEITITYTYEKPEMEEDEDGNLVIIDKSTSTVNITNKQLLNITATIKSIRNNIII